MIYVKMPNGQEYYYLNTFIGKMSIPKGRTWEEMQITELIISHVPTDQDRIIKFNNKMKYENNRIGVQPISKQDAVK